MSSGSGKAAAWGRLVRLSSLAILAALLPGSRSWPARPVACRQQNTAGAASRPEGRQGSPYILHSNVNLVVLHATVRDRQGRRVDNLAENDFRVYEDGVLQKLAVFSHADIPVTIGIVIDDSGSMRNERPAVNAAAWTFVKTSNPADQVFVVTFNTAYQIDTPGAFATNREQLRAALEDINSGGGTAVYDAIYASLDHLKLGNRDKKALLVISDGDDNASAHTFAQLLWRAARSSAAIYAIGLDEGSDDSGGGAGQTGVEGSTYANEVLTKLAQTTGGRAFFPNSLAQVDSVCRGIASAIRDQYTLGYYPSGVAAAGTFRRVRVEAFSPTTNQPLAVATKPGYYTAPSKPR
ncbi:MAG: VWA domain-containing protein [Terriglobia bacterium]